MKQTKQRNDRMEFCRLWADACAVMNQPAPNQNTLDILFSDLMEFSLEEVREALAYHRRHSRFAPLEADIFEYVNSQDCPDAEWDLVFRSIHGVGFSEEVSVCFENIRTAIAVNRMGGRRIIANRIGADGAEKCRQEFVRVFSQVTSVREYPAAMKYCPASPKDQRVLCLSENPAFRDSYVCISDLLTDLEKQNRKLSPEIIRTDVQRIQPPAYLIGTVYQISDGVWTGTETEALAAVRQGEGESLFRVSENGVWAIRLPKAGFVSKAEYRARTAGDSETLKIEENRE